MTKNPLMFSNFSRKKIVDSDLSNSDLSDSIFNGAIFLNSNLENSLFLRCSFSRCVFKNISFAQSSLNDCNFYSSEFIDCNFDKAILFASDLTECKLVNSSIENCDIRFSIGNLKNIKNIMVDTYHISFNNTFLAIGCRQYTHEQWRSFDDRTIGLFSDVAIDWWREWKDFIFMAIDKSINDSN